MGCPATFCLTVDPVFVTLGIIQVPRKVTRVLVILTRVVLDDMVLNLVGLVGLVVTVVKIAEIRLLVVGATVVGGGGVGAMVVGGGGVGAAVVGGGGVGAIVVTLVVVGGGEVGATVVTTVVGGLIVVVTVSWKKVVSTQ